MGARQSKRSVDITTTPKKNEGEIVTEGEGKVEKIAELDAKAATNGAVHSEIEYADKDDTTKESEKTDVKENGVSESEDGKTPEGDAPASGDQPNESTTTIEKSPEVEEKAKETPDSKKTKEKSKKKKFSFRSISFSKKDKSKPSKDSDKNGDVKEVAEENAEENVVSPSAETPKGDAPAPEEIAPATNGDATADELAKATDEASKTADEPTAVVVAAAAAAATEEPTKSAEEPKVPEPVKEIPPPAESAPSPPKDDDVKPPVEEPTPKVEESKPVLETPVEEIKEVRTEDVPPPLPSSNPPSPVMVFAESTKADYALPPVVDQDPVSVPVVESVTESIVVEPVIECPTIGEVTAQACSLPVKEIISEPEQTPNGVESTISAESLVEQVLPPPVEESKPEQIEIELKTDSISESVNETVTFQPSDSETISESVVLLTHEIDTKSASEPEPLPSIDPPVAEDQIPVEPPHSPPLGSISPIESTPSITTLDDPKEIEPLVNSTVTTEIESEISQQPNILPDEPFVEPALNADSLPDISTESLPSLPEPISESLPEPVSLPPMETFPEPIVNDGASPESLPTLDALSPPPLTSEMVLTNGNTSELPSPTINDDSLPPTEGPLKQIAAEITDKSETNHETKENATPAAATVEE